MHYVSRVKVGVSSGLSQSEGNTSKRVLKTLPRFKGHSVKSKKKCSINISEHKIRDMVLN